ncbi:MAG: hypothetical protein BWX47_02053 [candidate division Hyd24-12 bacterium ADurb.Bin004]|nr:MAG: hypothetical protein BWX47_02053 [candidate division Hyd24-12 bacterium ADurb.Bin004]
MEEVVRDALGGESRRLAQGGRDRLQAEEESDQRLHDALPEQDLPSVGNRRDLRAVRLPADEHLVHAADLPDPARELRGDLEQDGLQGARRLRVCHNALQLHRDWRQPVHGPRAHGEHRPVEALLDGRLLQLDGDAGLHGGRAAPRSDQLHPRRLFGDWEARALRPGSGRGALHRIHGGLQRHLANDRGRHRQIPHLSQDSRRDRRQGLPRRPYHGRTPGPGHLPHPRCLRVPGAEVLGHLTGLHPVFDMARRARPDARNAFPDQGRPGRGLLQFHGRGDRQGLLRQHLVVP